MKSAEVVIVGAGPAGMAAAVRASECGARVIVVDDNPVEGGQIWRGGEARAADRVARFWFQRFERCGAEVLRGARVIDGDATRSTVRIETKGDAFDIQYGK